MRITGGSARGRRLAAPGSGRDLIRPTCDRVREALFNLLGTRPRGSRVLDLFAGTGALGIEALSRGAEFALFVDRSLTAGRLIETNLRASLTRPAAAFARLARRWPQTGGPYVFARNAFGDVPGFLVAWSYWVSIWCGNAAIAVTFAGSVGALFPAATATPLRAAATVVSRSRIRTGEGPAISAAVGALAGSATGITRGGACLPVSAASRARR